jgi:type IV pilus assembly protein PilA
VRAVDAVVVGKPNAESILSRFRRGLNQMGFAQTLQQRRRCFIKCALAVAAIFLAASACGAQVAPVGQAPEVAWTQELNKYPGLLDEVGRLVVKLQSNVQFPPPRAESHLLPLLPESTMFYAAFPNYGNAAQQALTIFRQQMQENQALRDWWQHGKVAEIGPKVEDSLEKFSQLSQYLGEEVVVSGTAEGVVFVAEVRKPGLKIFLQQAVSELDGKSKPSVRLFDQQELATAEDANRRPVRPDWDPSLAPLPVILVRPDYMVAALDLATVRRFNARLDRHGREFVSTPFAKRLVQGYEGGVTTFAAADLQKILSLSPGAQSDLQQSGFADMKYLVWDHTNVAGQEVSQAELSFVAPRHGAAAWLAKPTPMASLDFVSPKAMLAWTVVLTNPAQVFDDVRQLASVSNPNEFATLTQAEQALKFHVKEELLSHLAGEITLELDDVTPPRPAWKAILKATDPERLQQSLSRLLAATHLSDDQLVIDGVSYHSVKIPSPQKPFEICYAFVDGYLVVGSNREGVTEGIRLHRSGESLGKSQKLLAALPPGRSPAASALLYQDPVALAALNLRQFAPQMAGTLSQSVGKGTPSVICFYGEDTAIREASRSGSFDVGAILVVAAIAIPNLLRSKIAANEATAVGSIRTVNTAQVVYATTYPKKGYAPNLAALGPDPRGPNTYSADHAGLIDEILANESCTADAWCTKSGFHFKITAVCKQHRCEEYVVLASPIGANTGTRSFCSTSDGVIHYKTSPPLISAASVSECRAWSPLQ